MLPAPSSWACTVDSSCSARTGIPRERTPKVRELDQLADRRARIIALGARLGPEGKGDLPRELKRLAGVMTEIGRLWTDP
jgi:hypothetical protein